MKINFIHSINFPFKKTKNKSRRFIACAIILLIGLWWFFSLPSTLFHTPTSTAIYSSDGNLLGASIAEDEQWRFPLTNELPAKFTQSLVSFEDERFYYHPGIDIFSIGRALVSNIREQRIVSGASTLSMQVIRLHRIDKPRVWKEKIIEMILAIRLECRYSKKEILALWSAHAPFGGNVVGLEAASWRYYGRPPISLSWGEAATLAVLPNAPTIIHPGKNRNKLLTKRNRLLNKLVKDQVIDSLTAELASLEPLPERPQPMPRLAPHLLAHAKSQGQAGQRIKTTLNFHLQKEVNELISEHHKKLNQNQIHNAAIIILDVKTNEILSYVGNTHAGKDHSEDVDVARARRSSGSILKPFLYAAMNQNGSLLPKEIVADIPTQVAGYRPKNFHDKYDGAVPANEALSRSLNIPAVRMLQTYGVEKFHGKLQAMHFSTINQPPHHYGLSLILGGAEVTLWDLTRAYGSMARVVNKYHDRNGLYTQNDWDEINYIDKKNNENVEKPRINNPIIDAASAYLTFEALTSVKRPESEFGWSHFSTPRKVAWKTGTSIGFRDAWAVGVTPEYIVAVWVGNADGEGRPNLVGVRAAAPLLFNVFRSLPTTSWFEPPHDELRVVSVCLHSGLKASQYCNEKEQLMVHKNARRSLPCSFHKPLFTDLTGEYEANAACFDLDELIQRSQFVLPPAMAYYFRRQHADYEDRLPLHPNCVQSNFGPALEIVYPQPSAEIKVPVDILGETSQAIFEVAHVDPNATVFWHIDGEFVGKTASNHALAMNPPAGKHLLKVIDEMGNSMVRRFEVVD